MLQRTCFLSVARVSSFRLSHTNTSPLDVVVVGGGIVGLATGREIIKRYPKLRMLVVEKEPSLAVHQTGHNSGVIHTGIYYAPGSLKAKLCVEGMKLTYDYVEQHGIPHKKCGKLIVAVDEKQLKGLDDLMNRATANRVPGVTMVSGREIASIEPNCRGLRAIHSPNTGIVDFQQVAVSLGRDFSQQGGQIFTSFEVSAIKEAAENGDHPVIVEGKIENGKTVAIQCRYVITCGGLQSDRLAQMTKCPKDPKIIPFRGDYLKLKPESSHLVRGNIYPVPDPRFPFLGVHFTRRIDGSIWLGPNAVLALKREGYGMFDFRFSDAWDSFTYPGFYRVARKYFSFGVNEMFRAFFTSLQVKQLQRYVPQLKKSDVERGPSGVRAQALDSQGQLMDDFVIHFGEHSINQRVMHIRNAPSPAATSALAIARFVADQAEKQFTLSG